MNAHTDSTHSVGAQNSYPLKNLSRSFQRPASHDVEAQAGLPPPANPVRDAETDDNTLYQSWMASRTKASRSCCSNMSRSMKIFLGITVLLLVVAAIVIVDRTLANISGTTDFDPNGSRT